MLRFIPPDWPLHSLCRALDFDLSGNRNFCANRARNARLTIWCSRALCILRRADNGNLRQRSR